MMVFGNRVTFPRRDFVKILLFLNDILGGLGVLGALGGYKVFWSSLNRYFTVACSARRMISSAGNSPASTARTMRLASGGL